MNRNLKTILLGVFTLIATTEFTYSIIFTGPARRNAHRHKSQDAYAAGLADGAAGVSGDSQSAEDNQSDNPVNVDDSDSSDVTVQMFSGDDDTSTVANMSIVSVGSDNVSDRDNENDDNMSIVSVVSDNASDRDDESVNPLDESFMVTSDNGYNFDEEAGYGDDLVARGQDQEQARQEAIADHDNNSVEEEVLEDSDPEEQAYVFLSQSQDTPYDSRSELPRPNNEYETFFESFFGDNHTPTNDYAINQALQDVELDDDYEAASTNGTFITNLFDNDNNEENNDNVSTQSIELKTEESTEDVPAVPEIKNEEVKVETPSEDTLSQTTQLETPSQDASNDNSASEEEMINDQEDNLSGHDATSEENNSEAVVESTPSTTSEDAAEEQTVAADAKKSETDDTNIAAPEEETKAPETQVDSALDNDIEAEVEESLRTDDDVALAEQAEETESSETPVNSAIDNDVETEVEESINSDDVALVTPTEEITTPIDQATSTIETNSEQVKIVKVYPVLDAVRSAAKGIRNAGSDMFNYIHSFVLSHRKKEATQRAQVSQPEEPGTTK